MVKIQIFMNKSVYLGHSKLKLSFGVIMENQIIMKKQDCVIWIQLVSSSTPKQTIFIKTLWKMLKQHFNDKMNSVKV